MSTSPTLLHLVELVLNWILMHIAFSLGWEDNTSSSCKLQPKACHTGTWRKEPQYSFCWHCRYWHCSGVCTLCLVLQPRTVLQCRQSHFCTGYYLWWVCEKECAQGTKSFSWRSLWWHNRTRTTGVNVVHWHIRSKNRAHRMSVLCNSFLKTRGNRVLCYFMRSEWGH